jgi:tetratricopeptide (TPR) repeat protein
MKTRSQLSLTPGSRLLAILLVASGGAAVLGWGLKARSAAPATASISSGASLLAALPSKETTATDKEIQKWKTKASQSEANPSYWLNLGDALMQGARESANHQYYDWAERAYQQTLRLVAQKSDAMTGLAWVSGGRHQFQESIAWAEKALALNPKDSAAYGLIGDAQIELGDYKAALASYQKMLDIRPDLSSYSRGAQLLYLLGDTRKAMWLMTKAIKAGGAHSENTAWCSAKLAEMLLGEGAVLPAENLLKDAQKATPNSYATLTALGQLKTARGLYQEAIALYEKAIAIAPQHTGLVALGDLYALTDQKTKAEEIYALVEKLHEEHKNKGSKDELYMARFFADHDRELRRALEIAERHREAKNAVSADTVAWCFYKNNRLAEAKEASDRARRAASPDSVVLFHAGMIAAALKERSAAQSFLGQALSRNPYFRVADARLASETLQALGSTPTAIPAGGVPTASEAVK